MPTRRGCLAGAFAILGATTPGCGFLTDSGSESGDDGGVNGRPTAGENGGSTADVTPLVFSTPAFEDGESIPTEYTGAGEDHSPPFRVESVPETAETLALVVDDPDAGDFVHWVLWNVPADVSEVPADLPQTATLSSLGGARQGTNDFGELGYRGPLPPSGDGPHTYRFTMFALSTTLALPAGSRRDALADALDGQTVARYRITGEFERG